MPNLCSNVIIITGDQEKVKSVLKKIKEIKSGDDKILFETILGKDTQGRLLDSNLERFGTKWDVSVDDCKGQYDDDSIVLKPKTSGSPAVNFSNTLAREYGVNVEHIYFNAADDYAGKVIINSEGVTTEELDYTYKEGIYLEKIFN